MQVYYTYFDVNIFDIEKLAMNNYSSPVSEIQTYRKES